MQRLVNKGRHNGQKIWKEIVLCLEGNMKEKQEKKWKFGLQRAEALNREYPVNSNHWEYHIENLREKTSTHQAE